jgi:hypothetical protein
LQSIIDKANMLGAKSCQITLQVGVQMSKFMINLSLILFYIIP